MRTVSWLLAIVAGVAAGAVCFSVESIIGTCPVLAVLGIVLALRATKVGRTDYFVLGLTEAIVTAALALTIAVFNLSSRAAVAPAFSVLIVNAIASLAMCWWLANRSVHDSPKLSTPAPLRRSRPPNNRDKLFVVEFHARWAAGRQFKDAALQSLVPNAKSVAIPVQDLDPVPVAIDEQK